jgi:hypothetical protein
MARKMFEEMLEGNDEELKKDIQKILGECNIPDFQTFEEDDFTFIKEMIDVPKNIEQRVQTFCSCCLLLNCMHSI